MRRYLCGQQLSRYKNTYNVKKLQTAYSNKMMYNQPIKRRTDSHQLKRNIVLYTQFLHAFRRSSYLLFNLKDPRVQQVEIIK
jgi:hypothetical protein